MTKLSKAVVAVAVAALTATSAFATIPAQTNCSYVFNTNMKLGMRNADVMNLQKVLNMDARTQVSASGVGSAGQETMYFGNATFAAVKKFQSLNGVAPVSGYAATLTRGVLNQICTTTGNTSTSTSSNVNVNGVNVASQNIPVGVLAAGQAGAKLADFVVNANGTVTNVTLQRTGISTNASLPNVYLYDGVTRITDASSVNSGGYITFNAPSGLFTVNGSKTLTVRADIAGTAGGQTLGVAMTGLTLMGATSSTPVSSVGPLFSVASAVAANVTFSGSNVATNPSLTIPRTNYSVWNTGVNVSTNNVNLKALTLEVIGSIPNEALSNVKLMVDGVQVATSMVTAVGGSKRIVFDLSSSPKLLTTGGHTLDVRSDIVTGATRNFKLSLMNVSDLMIEDSTLTGVGIAVSNYPTNKESGLQTLVGASNTSVNIYKDTTYTTTNITPGASNVVLGKYKLTAYGEDTKVQTVQISTTNSNPANIGLFVNGAQVGNTISNGTAPYVFNLGSNFVATAGTEYTLEVRGNASHHTTGAPLTSGTVQTTFDSASGVGQYSQNSFSTSPAAAGQVLTFGGGNYAVGNVISNFNNVVSPNTSNAKIGSFSIQAGTTEGADVRTFAIAIGGTGSATYLTNVRLVDAATGAEIAPAQPGASLMSFTPSTSFVVPAGQTKTVNLVANTGNQTVANTVIPTLTLTGYGAVSNQSLTFTNNPIVGTTVTYNAATTGAPTCSSKLNAQDVLGGSSLGSVCVLNFTSTNGGSTINDLTFTTSGIAGAVESVTVNGSTLSPNGTSVAFSGLNIAVPTGNNGVNVPVSVKYSSAYVGSGSGVATGATAGMTLSSMKATADGQSPVTTSPALSVSNTMTLRATLPSVSKVLNSGTSVSTGNALTQGKIGSIKVSADAAGDIVVGTLSYTLSAPAAISNVILKVNGTQALDKNGTVHAACSTTACTFTNGYRITSGTSVQFDVFADVAAPGAGISGTTDASVGAAGSFLWSDDVTTNGSGLSGSGLPSSKYQQ
jgi:hypothetical protein